MQLAAAPAAQALETGLNFGTATGLSTQDIRVTVAKIIRVAFGLLGVVAIGIVLTGGFLWMTSAGNEEKLEKAKKVLTNGVIGLVIMLLSFAITQFVISRLTEALYGQGGVTIATEGGGTLPPGAMAGGCADPGGTVPFVCSISPISGPVGSYVTIRGYRFGPYSSEQSSVRIGGVLAPIVACGGGPNWADNLMVVKVPTLDAGRSHTVQVTALGGGVSGNPISFGVTTDPVGPQIACIVPNQGPEGTILSIDGKNFGAERGSADVRFGGGVSVANISSWIDTAIATSIPPGAQSGEVTVVRDGRTSNGYPLTVTCSAGSQCSVSNCCTQGQCVEASACAPGGPPSTIGASCDANTTTPACDPGVCGGGLRCDFGSCTCQEGPTITAMSPQTLVSVSDGTAYRRAEDVPAGTSTVTAPNGSPGNYLTIRGRGFGNTVCSNDATKRCSRNADCGDGGTCIGLGRVVFMGGADAADDRVAVLAPCATAWTDTEVIAVVPAGAALGPIRIETVDPQFFDQSDDARGAAIEHFRLNTTQRPGLCAITPPSALIGAAVTLAGTQFGASKGAEDSVLFGDQSAATAAWVMSTISATVPALAEGPVEVRVRRSGELSNGVTFARAPEPTEPRIQEIIPNRGGGGQYVTIRGEHFGSAIGRVTFTRGAETYEVRPRFPDQCSVNWWKGNEITIRIPANRGEWGPPDPPAEGFNALGAYEVRVHARDGNAFRASNAAPFTVTTDQPTPGICAITPSSGPARTPVQLIGERFGGAVGAIHFFDGIVAGIGDGGADRAGNFQWAEGLVRGVLVPATARTGPVRLWQAGQIPTRDDDAAVPGLQGNQGSNPVTFEVKDCRAGGAAACAGGQICCGNGTCVANAAACAAGPNQGSFQWTFSTGVIPKMPRVVESCDAFSPSPWDGQGQGMQACVNANIRVQFSTSMATMGGAPLDAEAARNGIQVFRCGGGTNIAAAAGGTFEGVGAVLPVGWNIVESAWVTASRIDEPAPPAPQAHGGTGMLRLAKTDETHAKAPTQPPKTDVPRDTPTDRHYFAITAPATLIPDTNGTTYTARVFVRDPTPAQNPNRRAGIVIGRNGGPQPTGAGWYQQVATEVAIDGTWKELAVSITFDAGPNSRQQLNASGNPTGPPMPGFLRLYMTGPPPDEPVNANVDVYAVEFDDLEVMRAGDACAVREEVQGLPVVAVDSELGRLQLTNNVITVPPPLGGWAAGTWYEVLLYGDDTTISVGPPAIVKRALMSASDPQLRLDGDKDGQEGGNYRFRFHTRESAEPCAVQSVLTTPIDGLATQRGPEKPADLTTTTDLPGLVHLRADGVGDPTACFLLNTSGMPWTWATVAATNPPASPYLGFGRPDAGPEQLSDSGGGRWCLTADDCAVITCQVNADCAPWDSTAPTCDVLHGRCTGTPFCPNSRRCTLPVSGENYFANTATTRGVAETPVNAVGVPQPVTVEATVAPASGQPRTGESHVRVRFERPRVTAVYPTALCQQACPNGGIVAIMNIDLLPATVDSPATNVQLWKCDQENCRRRHPDTGADELEPVGGAIALACPQLPRPPGSAADPCAGIRVSADPQVIITHPPLGPPPASYRVILRSGTSGVQSLWGVPLDGLNYADNDAGTLDAYSWTFRTRSEACTVSRIDLSPNPLVLHAVGERAAIVAVPFSAPDQCSPIGQPLDAETLDWQWGVSAATVAGFTRVTAAGAFAPPGPASEGTITRTSRTSTPSCTLQCLRPGSRRVSGICGNTVTEPGEECETTDLDADGDTEFASWCDAASCLRMGAKPIADGGTCGDGDVDPGEECDGGQRCAAGGPRAGESCSADADCAVTVEGVTASSVCTFVFPTWCDPASCLRKGSGFGSVCGNGNPATQENPLAPLQAAGDGEDCDDGNTVGGDGCSSRCLNEGTPRRYHPTEAPDGILARCGDGVIADGLRANDPNTFDCDGTPAKPCALNHEPNGGEECDRGAVPRATWEAQRCDYDRCVRTGNSNIGVANTVRCGNGDVDAVSGEQCDDGEVGTCGESSTRNAFGPCGTNADCRAAGSTVGTCEDPRPVDGDGCSPSCLLEGASITWRNAVTGVARPSMCGDGAAFDGRSGRPFGGEACDAGSVVGSPDPVQIIQAVGRAPADAEGIQRTDVTARATVEGRGTVELVCGHQSDAECDFPEAFVAPETHGIDRLGCCQLRPSILTAPNESRYPAPAASNVCRNAQITARFDRLMDPGSVGVVTDVATGASFRRGAVLEQCKDANVGCRVDVATDWEATAATPTLVAALVGSATVSELRFALTSPLASGVTYRVVVFDTASDIGQQPRSIRSIDGVRLGASESNRWTFTAGTQVCLMDRVVVQPATSLLQRRESRAPLEVTTWARTPAGEAPITEVAGYAWTYGWSSTATDVAVPDPGSPEDACGDRATCRFKTAEPPKNGEAFGRATVTITENVFASTCTPETASAVCGQGRACVGGHCVHDAYVDQAFLRAFICENPWPAVESGGAGALTWAPYEVPDEHIAIAYCRDQGDRMVCRNDPAKPCAQSTDCGNLATDPNAICALDASDDLPPFQWPPLGIVTSPPPTSGDGQDALRKEYFFLPRGVSYCSVSGERCDPTLAGICPPGEFCRDGQDAIGLRMFENEQHVAAARWFQRQGFTESTTPVEVDGYRGVRAGRSTYLNIANVGSIFTNLAVLSFNDGAVEETKEILQRVLAEIRLSTNLTAQNVRVCMNGKRCAVDGAVCIVDAHCPGTGNRCVQEQPFPCTANRDCRRVDAVAVIDGDTCDAPKDKLARDLRRLEDLNEIRLAVEDYGRSQARCSVTPQACILGATAGQPGACPAGETCFTSGPVLSAGTFIPGLTTSRWPSWAAELGQALGMSLPLDPLNTFGGACVAAAEDNTKYDQATCWNQESGTYTAPPGSYLYEYARTPTGVWSVRAGFEYIDPDPGGATGLRPADAQPAVDGNQPLPSGVSATLGGVPAQAHTATGRCGDGILQDTDTAGEECDPPGSTETPTTCTPTGGAANSGSQFRTCQQDCRWSPASTCASRCGNFVVDAGEQCDVGPNGGRVPPGHPTPGTVPGITAGTQYACSSTCTWTGGVCFDGVVQSAYGEACDLSIGELVTSTSNVALTPVQSSSATQYWCTTVAGGSANPCRGTSGFCGDGVVQDGMIALGTNFTNEGVGIGYTCDGSSTVCASGHGPKPHDYDDPPDRIRRYEQCDGDEVRSCAAFAKCGGSGALCATDADCAGAPAGQRACVTQPNLAGGSLPYAMLSNADLAFPFYLRQPGGSLRVTVETSNNGSDLSSLTRDQIEAHLPTGKTINDYNPQGAQGSQGLYHRIKVRVCDDTAPPTDCVESAQPIWALASTATQVNTVVVDGLTEWGERRIIIEWDNDWWQGAGQPLDSNLRIHRVTVSGSQTRSCGQPGTSAACRVLNAAGGVVSTSAEGVDVVPLGWRACVAAGAQCGNGTVDAGEECDDGGKGRCANELSKVCTSSTECSGGAACERDIDACTSECKRNVCGDARQLAPTCTAGHASKIGQPCTSNAQCGTNGLCATEQCDLGASNWRQGSQCLATGWRCLLSSGGVGPACTDSIQCLPPGVVGAYACADPQCVDRVACPYGRTCNYCVVGSCSVATKQGGFCGDRVKNGPEACDLIDGTNQCDELSGAQRASCRNAVGVANLDWSRQICNAACDAMCPPATTTASLRFGGTASLGSTLTTEAQFSAGGERFARVDACRLLDAFRYDVELGPGVDVWPVPVSVVVVTDRSGSMGRDVVEDCNGNGVTNVAGTCTGGDRNGGACTHDDECLGTPTNGTCNGETINDSSDSRMRCTRHAIKGHGDTPGLLDKLATARDPGDVRVALVSYGNTVQTDSEFRDVADATERATLESIVGDYSPTLGGTATHLAIDRAAELLDADASAQTKVIVLLSDGIANDMAATEAAANAFKLPGGHRYLFTIAYPIPRPGMTGWSSGGGFSFSGTDLGTFYEQIVGAIAGVSITLLPSSGDSPSAVTYVNRTQTGVRVAAGDEFAETCAFSGQPSTYRVRVNFRARPGSTTASRYVWLRNASALVCTGPPWRGALKLWSSP